MDAEMFGGMVLVAAVLLVMTVIVLVCRARIERTHRQGLPGGDGSGTGTGSGG